VATGEHMFDNGAIFDSRILLGRLRGDAKDCKQQPYTAKLEDELLEARRSDTVVEMLADEIEARLPRGGRRPVAWIVGVGWEAGPEGPKPYVDIEAVDSFAAASVAQRLSDIAGLTSTDWLFRWARGEEGHRVIRTYPESSN
jgi:hypothetical protein